MNALDSVSLRPSSLALIDREIAARIARELEEAAQALEASQWMPIETAPKDGTAVMLGNSGGAWIGRFMQFAQSGYRFDDPWRSLMLNHYHIPYEHRYKAPTHWMPLPAAPAAQVAQEGAAGVATRHPRCGYPYCACVGECFAASQPGGAHGVAPAAPTSGE